jgi:diketogulonate reductase-like aldo/keto reductase
LGNEKKVGDNVMDLTVDPAITNETGCEERYLILKGKGGVDLPLSIHLRHGTTVIGREGDVVVKPLQSVLDQSGWVRDTGVQQKMDRNRVLSRKHVTLVNDRGTVTLLCRKGARTWLADKEVKHPWGPKSLEVGATFSLGPTEFGVVYTLSAYPTLHQSIHTKRKKEQKNTRGGKVAAGVVEGSSPLSKPLLSSTSLASSVPKEKDVSFDDAVAGCTSKRAPRNPVQSITESTPKGAPPHSPPRDPAAKEKETVASVNPTSPKTKMLMEMGYSPVDIHNGFKRASTVRGVVDWLTDPSNRAIATPSGPDGTFPSSSETKESAPAADKKRKRSMAEGLQDSLTPATASGGLGLVRRNSLPPNRFIPDEDPQSSQLEYLPRVSSIETVVDSQLGHGNEEMKVPLLEMGVKVKTETADHAPTYCAHPGCRKHFSRSDNLQTHLNAFHGGKNYKEKTKVQKEVYIHANTKDKEEALDDDGSDNDIETPSTILNESDLHPAIQDTDDRLHNLAIHHAVALGTLALGVCYPHRDRRPSREKAVALVRAAVEQGVHFIDTADVYCEGDMDTHYAERVVAEALSILPLSTREKIVVATKGGMTRSGNETKGYSASSSRSWKPEILSPPTLKAKILASQKALQWGEFPTFCRAYERPPSRPAPIDLWMMHHTDGYEAEGDVFKSLMEQLLKMVERKNVRAVGLCNCSTTHVKVARTILGPRLVAVSNSFSLLDRGAERRCKSYAGQTVCKSNKVCSSQTMLSADCRKRC